MGSSEKEKEARVRKPLDDRDEGFSTTTQKGGEKTNLGHSRLLLDHLAHGMLPS